MKVLTTAPWGEQADGAGNLPWKFVRQIKRARIEPKLVFFQNGPFARRIVALAIHTAVLPSGRIRELHRAARAVRAFAEIIRRERPDLILGWSAKTYLHGAPAAALAGASDLLMSRQHGIRDGRWLDRATPTSLLLIRALSPFRSCANE
jgi:hypothetical protein